MDIIDSEQSSTSVSMPTGSINGHEWVNLGLSVLWATCNVGATSPEKYGDYFAWGEINPKDTYTKTNSVTRGKQMDSIAGDAEYDAARANWGGTWRLPTREEIDELFNKCQCVWTTLYGVNGYKVTGPNGNSIFFPAAGCRNGSSLRGTGDYCGYWSATPVDKDCWSATPVDEDCWSATPDDEDCWGDTPDDEGYWSAMPDDEDCWSATPDDEDCWSATPDDEDCWSDTPDDEDCWSDTPSEDDASCGDGTGVAYILGFGNGSFYENRRYRFIGRSVRPVTENMAMTPHLQVGTVLQGGKYRLTRFLGEGDFGCTYEAEHTLLASRVAIKEFFPKAFCHRDAATGSVTVATESRREVMTTLRRQFIEEAKVICALHHENIVHILDIFEENDAAYYVMDYIDGKSLRVLLTTRGPLPEAVAVGYLRQVAAAVDYIHRHHRLHLAITPGHIMIESTGRALLIDFGTSQHYAAGSGENTSPLVGVPTPGFAPIEQMNALFSSFTPATDIYALGATLYKCLSGLTPPSAVALLSEEETFVPLPPDVSTSTRAAVAAAMQLKREDRPHSVAAFLTLFSTTWNINGYEWVDLGLSVMWATCNVGASSPEEYGDYFAWGEAYTKSGYTVANSVTYGKQMGSIAGNARYDAARAIWGFPWRLPTASEINELVNKCQWTWTTLNGVKGYKVTGPNGNSIFLPAAGWRDGSSLYGAGDYGFYWSAAPYVDDTGDAYALCFGSKSDRIWPARYYGFPVRPVTE